MIAKSTRPIAFVMCCPTLSRVATRELTADERFASTDWINQFAYYRRKFAKRASTRWECWKNTRAGMAETLVSATSM